MVVLQRPSCILSAAMTGGGTLRLSLHPLDLLQQGKAGRQVHLLELLTGQTAAQVVDFLDLGLDLLPVVL